MHFTNKNIFLFLAPLSNGEGDQKGHEAEIKEFSKLKEAFSALQSEQEDLLMMLSEQDVKLRSYKKIIKGLGQAISLQNLETVKKF